MTAPARLLYVDDDESLTRIVQNQLAEEGYEITTAADGDEALELLATRPIDLVILDIRMPNKDGLAVLQEMRKKNLRPRVIMLTAVDELDVAINAAKLGANDYLTKPFGTEALLHAVRRVLQQ